MTKPKLLSIEFKMISVLIAVVLCFSLVKGLSLPEKQSTTESTSEQLSSAKLDLQLQVTKLLSFSLSTEQCLLMCIFLTSMENDKAAGKIKIPSRSKLIQDIARQKFNFLYSTSARGFTRRNCRSFLKKWWLKIRKNETVGSDMEIQLLITDGLVMLNKTDLKDEIASVFNRKRHNDIQEALGEIKSHNISYVKSRNTTTVSTQNASSADSDDDEYVFENLVCILTLSIIIFLLVVRSLIVTYQSEKVIATNSRSRYNRIRFHKLRPNV